MEGLIATDWLKDYDPLFELFDEEMGAGQPFTQAQAATNCDYGFASDYYDTCAYHNYSSSSHYAGASQRPADELSLILGLDWMSGLELAPASNVANSSNNIQVPQAPSPSRSLSSSCASSASSSCAPSPPATSTSAGSSVQTQCSSSSSSASAQSVTMAPVAPVSIPMVQPVLVEAPVADLNENNGGLVFPGPKLVPGPLKPTVSSHQQQRVFRIQLQNHSSALNAASNNIIGHHGVASGLVGTNLIGNISGSPNGISNTSLALSTTTSSSALKRKKRCIRTKGTSLLAQPSPKSAANNNSNGNNNSSVNLLPPTNSSYSSAAPLTTAAPLSTLLTISKTSSVASGPALSQQVLPAVAMSTAATTTITITTPSATSNLSPLGINHHQPDHHHYHTQRLQLHQSHHHPYHQCLKMTTNANSGCNNASRSQQIHHQTTNLTSLVRNMRYCVQIEHAYSTLSAAFC